ncbi:MAG: hypothetical protein WBX38_06300, partial [Candidatus Sulfotelmatobacter sp.]
MLKAFTSIPGIGFVLIFLATSFAVGQQAPRPAQILAAKKVFISNASGESYDLFFSAPDQPYEQFYAGLKTLGRYELVASPAEADLVLEIHFVPARATEEAYIELVFLDPKTRITLWTIIEKVGTAARQSTGRKNFEKAMSLLLQDLAK